MGWNLNHFWAYRIPIMHCIGNRYCRRQCFRHCSSLRWSKEAGSWLFLGLFLFEIFQSGKKKIHQSAEWRLAFSPSSQLGHKLSGKWEQPPWRTKVFLKNYSWALKKHSASYCRNASSNPNNSPTIRCQESREKLDVLFGWEGLILSILSISDTSELVQSLSSCMRKPGL